MKKGYELKIDKKVLKFFSKLSKKDEKLSKILFRLIHNLEDNPFDSKKMTGKFKGLNRVKHGDYRIIFRIDKKNGIIRVLEVGKRSNIYK